jgi:ABC-type uncharacterized transport system involved in gliding motility auxiliary subunit
MDRRRSLLGHTWLQLALWMAVALVVNHLASVWFVRLDLTESGAHTLTPAARQVVAGLERPLTARVYFTRGLEAPYNDHERRVVDALEELRAFSGGRIEIEVVDPTGDRAKEEEAQRLGVTPIQYRFRAQDRMELKSVYMGVAFVYGDRQEVVSPIATLDTLEYELVRAIHVVAKPSDERKVVGYLQGNGEPDLAAFAADNPIGQLRERLAAQVTLRPVVLGGDEGVPEEVDALLVIGPQSQVPLRAQYQLDQFVMKGGPIAFFLSSVRPDFQAMRATEVRHDLNALLGHFGVMVGKDVLIDRTRNEVMRVPVAVGGRPQLVPVNYPLIPVTSDLDPSSPVVKGLDRAVVPFAATLGLAERLPDGVTGGVWVRTEATSAAVAGLRHLRPDVLARPIPDEVPGAYPVAVGLVGPFTSFFANRPIPPPAGALPDDPAREQEALTRVLDGAPSRMIVVSSADFVANNLPFVLNAVDWMLQDELLISIRSRAVDVDRLDAPEAGSVGTWRLGLALGPAVPLALLALLAWWRSR